MDKNANSPARERLALLFDDGIYSEINSMVREKDALTGVVTAYGYVNGNAVYAYSQDKTVNSAAMGIKQAEKITKLYELAAKTGAPIVGIHDSNGAYVDGTAASLAAYGKIIEAASKVSGVVPQISVITGTCAGSAALIACSSDFVIMTKESELFMAPCSNDNPGTAQKAAEAGLASLLCNDDKSALDKARELINLLPVNNLSAVPMFEYNESGTAPASDLESLTGSVADADSIIEIGSEYGTSAYTALASIGGTAAGIAATNKSKEKLTADDCAKLARFMRTCDAFSIPVVTFVDTEGFADGNTISGIKAMTLLANSYAEATTVKISVVTGKSSGPVFTAVAGSSSGSDFTFAWENAVISPFASETAVEFLWHDKLRGAENLEAKRKELTAEYEASLASAASAAEGNYIDEIISSADTRKAVMSAFDILSGKRVQKLPKKHNNIPF
ncbi:MAG: carboxyl transferase [Oscillospiraceae bacterium]|nr:carboxyl transferase [Oscillospiraceae bacterium]